MSQYQLQPLVHRSGRNFRSLLNFAGWGHRFGGGDVLGTLVNSAFTCLKIFKWDFQLKFLSITKPKYLYSSTRLSPLTSPVCLHTKPGCSHDQSLDSFPVSKWRESTPRIPSSLT